MKTLLAILVIFSALGCSSASQYEFPISPDRCSYLEERVHGCSEALMKPGDEKKAWSCKRPDPHFEMIEQLCRHERL